MQGKIEQVPISVRVPTEIATALQRTALLGDRTLAAEVRRALRCHVQSFPDEPDTSE